MSDIRANNIFFMSINDWNKIISYAQSSYNQFKAEIGGQLTVIEDDGVFKLLDPVILKQDVSSGNCEMEAEALAIYYHKLYEKYGDKVRHCWWHSHHTMDAFWSGTDNSTIMEQKTNDFSLSLVVNLKREYKLRLQFFHPIEQEVDVTLNLIGEKVSEDVDAEVKELCSNAVQTITHYGYNGKQSNLWTKQDKKEVDHYNHSFGLWDEYDDEVNLSLVPDDKLNDIMTHINTIVHKINSQNINKEQCAAFNKQFSDLNKGIKKYNLKIPRFHKHDMETFKYTLIAPEDILENIQPMMMAALSVSGGKNANK